jgi:alkylhydroperoxidase/carboxymuconolactone decarboxylase family protein YurZ
MVSIADEDRHISINVNLTIIARRFKLKRQSGRKSDERLAFRRPLPSINSASPESREVYDEIKKRTGHVPEIYTVKALADNPSWLKLLHRWVFQWPQGCALDEKTKELVGLAKSIALTWEPGVLTNIEGALAAGATSNEITEATLVASTVAGLADLDQALSAGHFEVISDDGADSSLSASVRRVYDDAIAILGGVPETYRFKILIENPDWLNAVHESTKILYLDGVLERRARTLVSLGASAARRWERGIREHVDHALQSGASPRMIADVLCSIYKTSVSIGVETGFGVPCSIPEMSGFRLLKDYYPKQNAFSRSKTKTRS